MLEKQKTRELKKGKYQFSEAEIRAELKNDQKLLQYEKDLDTIIASLTDSAPMRTSLKEYVRLMESMHSTLKNGTDATIESIVLSLKDNNIGEAINPKTNKPYNRRKIKDKI